jgi:hypothetical protein
MNGAQRPSGIPGLRAAGRRTACPVAALMLVLLPAAGCSHAPAATRSILPRAAERPPTRDDAIYRAAQDARTAYLEREVARLQADLAQAEEAMVTIESGLRGQHTRADAVSTVADARIAVERAARRAPWREREIEEARAKLAEAERQLRAGYSGSALFFASRATRISETLTEEASQVERFPGTRFVDTARANLRGGPSTRNRIVVVLPQSTPVFPERYEGSWLLVRTPAGPVGWLHESVLDPR